MAAGAWGWEEAVCSSGWYRSHRENHDVCPRKVEKVHMPGDFGSKSRKIRKNRKVEKSKSRKVEKFEKFEKFEKAKSRKLFGFMTF